MIIENVIDGNYKVKIRDVKGTYNEGESSINIECCKELVCIGSILMKKETKLEFLIENRLYRIELSLFNSNGNVIYKNRDYVNGTLVGEDLIVGVHFYVISLYLE